MAETQTPSGGPQDGRSQLDLTLFADGLQRNPDGVWRGRGTEPVSFPAAGNNTCFALEDSSFWFTHRNACLLAVLRQFSTIGPFLRHRWWQWLRGRGATVGGRHASNPGRTRADGVRHAQAHGLRAVVYATLKEARFRDGSLPAIGFFDVMEHIDDEHGFLCKVCRCLAANGRIYLTVPAGRWLWSDADVQNVQAGHFRRYTFASLRRVLERAGFRPLFMSKIFSPLPLPLFLCRSLPSLFGHRRQLARSYSNQHRPRGRRLMDHVWHWELARLAHGRSIPCGTSCLAVAELSSSAHA